VDASTGFKKMIPRKKQMGRENANKNLLSQKRAGAFALRRPAIRNLGLI
jgi:hypothetical protein